MPLLDNHMVYLHGKGADISSNTEIFQLIISSMFDHRIQKYENSKYESFVSHNNL